MTETYVEKRKRGFFGWLFLLIFIGWNVLMLLWMISALSRPEAAGAAGGIAFFILLVIWAVGSVVTGLLALVFRGSKTIVRKSP
jgi:fucose permease